MLSSKEKDTVIWVQLLLKHVYISRSDDILGKVCIQISSFQVSLKNMADWEEAKFWNQIFKLCLKIDLESHSACKEGLVNKCMLYSHIIYIHLYTYTCENKINNNYERTHFFRKIYLSHFIRNGCEMVTKGLCVRAELETQQTATYWPPVPLSLAALRSRSTGPLSRGP